MPAPDLVRIGDFSLMGQVSVRMLRHYDKLGLLTPGHVDRWTGYRYYTLDQLLRLHQILAFRDLGLSLEQIRNLLDDPRADERLYEMLQIKQQAIAQILSQEQARLDRVAARLRQIERAYEPIPYDVALKTLAAQRIIGIRDVVPRVDQMGEVRHRMFGQLYGTLVAANVTPGIELAIYHMQDYAEENIDMSLAVVVADDATLPAAGNAVTAYTLPQSPLAAGIVCHDSIWNVPEIVANLYRWLGRNGYASAGSYREYHLFGRELDLFAQDPPGVGVLELIVPVEKL